MDQDDGHRIRDRIGGGRHGDGPDYAAESIERPRHFELPRG